MTATSVGVKIWAKTVIANAFIFAFTLAFDRPFEALIGLIAFLVGGLILTCPLVLLIVPLVRLSTVIPYGVRARIAFMTFYLALLIVAVYSPFMPDELAVILIGTTLAALLLAVLTTLTSLKKLHII